MYYTDDMFETQKLMETAAEYFTKKQGEYTLDDYYNLPDDIRVELIDGVIYYMTAPASVHQIFALYLGTHIYNHIKSHGGQCIVFMASADVQLNCDNKTMVQPDVFVVCDRNKIIKRCTYGVPDFIVEVLSPSTKKKDMIIKLNKYKEAGVKEYWMVDPDEKIVYIYDFSENSYLTKTFENSHSINVFEEPCIIDFKDMYEEAAFLYED